MVLNLWELALREPMNLFFQKFDTLGGSLEMFLKKSSLILKMLCENQDWQFSPKQKKKWEPPNTSNNHLYSLLIGPLPR